MSLKVDNRLSYLQARFRYLARDVKSTSSTLSSALSELVSIRQELDAYIADSSVSDGLDAMRAEINQILSQNKVIGKDIYVQPTEPLDPDCLWIDTNGIDLIME